MTTFIGNEARRNQISILTIGRKIGFPPKPDGQTYGRTSAFKEELRYLKTRMTTFISSKAM